MCLRHSRLNILILNAHIYVLYAYNRLILNFMYPIFGNYCHVLHTRKYVTIHNSVLNSFLYQ